MTQHHRKAQAALRADSGIEEAREPGDDDPSRVVPAAELGMSFDGRINGDSTELRPFMVRRLSEMMNRLGGRDGERSEDLDS